MKHRGKPSKNIPESPELLWLLYFGNKKGVVSLDKHFVELVMSMEYWFKHPRYKGLSIQGKRGLRWLK